MPLRLMTKLEAEPIPSVIGGILSLTIGAGALWFLASYLLDKPVGPQPFYEVQWFDHGLASRFMPSPVLLGLLPLTWCEVGLLWSY
jgi:hypothetical protein